MMSNFPSRTTLAADGEQMSSSMKVTPSGRLTRLPEERSSRTVTAEPWLRKARTTCEPMNPAPPVTSTFSIDGELDGNGLLVTGQEGALP